LLNVTTYLEIDFITVHNDIRVSIKCVVILEIASKRQVTIRC